MPQGNTLISGNVRDNLLLGNPQATESQLRDALHTAAADFVYTLPEGLDTPCGELGSGLSEGQAQRIAIARAPVWFKTKHLSSLPTETKPPNFAQSGWCWKENNLPLQVFGKCGYPFNILNKRAMPNIWISTLFYCNNTNFSLNL